MPAEQGVIGKTAALDLQHAREDSELFCDSNLKELAVVFADAGRVVDNDGDLCLHRCAGKTPRRHEGPALAIAFLGVGQPVHQLSNIRAELAHDVLHGGIGVLDGVVQIGGGY